MSLREATLADLDALVELERCCYPPEQAYSRGDYRYALGKAKAVNLVWQPAERVLGFVGAFHHRAWRTGHLYTVNVHPDARGDGLGRRLLAACEARLRALGMRRCVLEVNVENDAAIRLYERTGYARVRRLAGYYTTYPDPDAFLYAKDL